MRRPVVLWVVVVYAGLVTLGYALQALVALAWVMPRPAEALGQLFVSAVMVCASVWIMVGLLRRTLRSKLWVSLYLWLVLLAYPLCELLRGAGLYLAGPPHKPEELAGAAGVEGLRYIIALAMIVWVAASKALYNYLKTGEQPSSTTSPAT